MNHHALVPISDNGEFRQYVEKINRIPVLSEEEELDLSIRFHDHGDLQAAHRLVSAYLRYVVKIAREYQNYGMRMMDLIQEGSIGLMQAVKKFDPYKGFRLATYAMWWIRASIQEFILRSWSLVKIGTTASQRKLFFNLRKSKNTIERLDEAGAEAIGKELGVSSRDVLEMDGRLSGRDDSLNRSAFEDGEEVQNLLPDPRDNQEVLLLQSEGDRLRKTAVDMAMSTLSDREEKIVRWRLLDDVPLTLEDIGTRLGVSRERIRQVEKRALEKMRKALADFPLPAS